MTVKPLSIEQVDDIIKLQSCGFTDGWSKQNLLTGLRQGNLQGLLCYDGEQLIAFLTYTFNEDFAELMDILVDPNYRKKGIGDKLIKKFLTGLIGKTEKVFLEVRESNLPAINLYGKHGFKAESVRKKYYSDGENALVMVKVIL